MRKLHVLAVCLAIALGYIVGTSSNRTAAGQPPPPGPAVQELLAWRYQIISTDTGSYPTLILNDTATGRVWVRASNPRLEDTWHSLGSPETARPEPVQR
jgi:hypothetical protein